MLNNVVLPAPFGPMIPRILPRATSKHTSCSTLVPPKALQMPVTARIGPVVWTIGASGAWSTVAIAASTAAPLRRPVQARPITGTSPVGNRQMTNSSAAP